MKYDMFGTIVYTSHFGNLQRKMSKNRMRLMLGLKIPKCGTMLHVLDCTGCERLFWICSSENYSSNKQKQHIFCTTN